MLINLFLTVYINTLYADFLKFSYIENEKTSLNLLIYDNNFVNKKLFSYFFYKKDNRFLAKLIEKLDFSLESDFLKAKYYIRQNNFKEAKRYINLLIFKHSEIKGYYLLKTMDKNCDNDIKLIKKLIEINPNYILYFKDLFFKKDKTILKNFLLQYFLQSDFISLEDIETLKKINLKKNKLFYLLDKILNNQKLNIKKFYLEKLIKNPHFINKYRLNILFN